MTQLADIGTADRPSILVTGCGRSGTGYAAALLQAHGLDVGHEVLGRHGMSSWLAAGCDRRQPIAHFAFPSEFAIVVHQVRHPLDVVRSWWPIRNNVWSWARELVSPPPGLSDLEERAYYWLRWNQLAERFASYTYRLEALDSEYPRWAKELQLEPNPGLLTVVPRDVNGRRAHKIPRVEWDDFRPELRTEVAAAAERYGYAL